MGTETAAAERFTAPHRSGSDSRADGVTVTIDPRNFGESGGEPRQREDPAGKLADLRAACTAAILPTSCPRPRR
jgi:uncharacterized protein